MGDIKITASTSPAPAAAAPEKAASAVSQHAKAVKNAMFSDTGSAILTGAAAGALIGNLPGAVVGGMVGLGMAGFSKGTGSAAIFSGSAAALAAAVTFPPVGALLVGATAVTFASGAARQGAAKLGEFLGKHAAPTPEPSKH